MHLYCAREDFNKEKFIYENIQGEALVIVPDQYTLIGEEQALKYMKVACLLDVEIMSMSRLGLRALEEQGLENVPVLDKYERNMLLTKVIREHTDELEIFKNAANKRTFVEMISDFISQLKQQNSNPADLAGLADAEDADAMFARKLSEIMIIVDAYEEALRGRFADAEDYIEMYTKAIATAKQFQGKTVWVYGFDSLTPKLIDALIALDSVAGDVRVMINVSDFGLDNLLVARVTSDAGAAGRTCDTTVLTTADYPEYRYEKSPAIANIEKYLFSDGEAPADAIPGAQDNDVKLVECANPYYEAESAAAYVYELIRDHGYAMRDIVIICNDSAQMHPTVKRVFDEYNLPLFLDSMRGISDSQIATFIVSLLEAARYEYRTPAMLNILKSGLAGVTSDEAEELENYVSNYQIKGRMWTRPLKYGKHEYEETDFQKLEETRAHLAGKITTLSELGKSAESIDDFARKFYEYLEAEWNLVEQVTRLRDEQIELGMFEEAQRTVQSYNECIRILDRVRDILGDTGMDMAEFVTLYTEGVMGAEVGIIPPTLDGISLGTMIRTRPAPPRAVLVLGANEGVLPMEPSPEGLFSVDEKAYLVEKDFRIGALDDIKMKEENVAMYRVMSRASEKVYISYSMTDGAGSDFRPSTLVDSLTRLFPGLKKTRDVVSQGFGMPLVVSGAPALRHMVNHFKERPQDLALQVGADDDSYSNELADAIMMWYEQNDPEILERIIEAGRYENNIEKLSGEMAKRLFARRDGEFSFSASRLEKYNHCPFEHFVMHGLRPKEQREFKGGAREIGDIYHDCIMRVSQILVDEGVLTKGASGTGDVDGVASIGAGSAVADGVDPKLISRISTLVKQELAALSGEYMDGLFSSSDAEKYRLSRIEEICIEAIVVLVIQMRLGQIETSYFEEKFGRGCRFEPITYSLHGETVYIEGKIDRIDILKGGNVRIIDYKTGNDKLDLKQMRTGYKMQLMVYMQGAEGRSADAMGCSAAESMNAVAAAGAMGGSAAADTKADSASGASRYAPAGMFYFNISDSMIRLNGMNEAKQQGALSRERDKQKQLKGAYVDSFEVLEAMPEELVKGSSIGLTPETFEILEQDVSKTIELISDGIITGDIRIEPVKLRSGDRHAECKYCKYKPICRFDLTYKHNNYRMQ